MSKQDASLTKIGKVRNKAPVSNKGTAVKGDLGLQIREESKKCFCNREAAESYSRAKWVREDPRCSLHRDGG